MEKSKEARARERLQSRVAKVVWGLLFVTMGVLFGLDNVGKVDMGSSRFAAARAVDGSETTRWSSGFADPQWITIDLERPAEITRVKLNWQAAFATAYEIQGSDDGAAWTTLKSVTEGDGGVDEYDVSTRARYVRMSGSKRSTPWGYSLWEFEVYGMEPATPATTTSAPAGLLSHGKPAMASSMESVSLWPIYWPLLLVAGGLPALLVPKDGGDQVVGLALTAVGIFLQVRMLDLVSWGFREALPVLLVLTGLMLMLQSLRKAKPTEEAS
jgi:hypothetical protein